MDEQIQYWMLWVRGQIAHCHARASEGILSIRGAEAWEMIQRDMYQAWEALEDDPTVAAMRAIVDETMHRFQSDFYVHDVAAIYRLGDRPFLWGVDPESTVIAPIEAITADDAWWQDQVRYEIAHGNPHRRWYRVSRPGGITPLSVEAVREVMQA